VKDIRFYENSLLISPASSENQRESGLQQTASTATDPMSVLFTKLFEVSNKLSP
jgi:hypothetical protein